MNNELIEAATAVIARWDSTDWKAAPTAEVMNRLRAALSAKPVWSDDMTLRDYFAAKAMQGYITGDYDVYPHEIVQRAYAIADAMLEEKAK